MEMSFVDHSGFCGLIKDIRAWRTNIALSLGIGSSAPFAEECLKIIQKTGVNQPSLRNYLRKASPNESDHWKHWKFIVPFKTSIQDSYESIETSLLHVAIICQAVQEVRVIVEQALEENILEEILEETTNTLSDFKYQWEWLSGAKAIHLAAKYHRESLVYLLRVKPDLINCQTQGTRVTPLHIACTRFKSGTTSFLLDKCADVKALNNARQTALHWAVRASSINNVVTLLFESKISIFAKDLNKKTALHLAQSSKILNILLNKISKDKLTIAEELNDSVFAHVLRNNPGSIEKYLNTMINAEEDELDQSSDKVSFQIATFQQLGTPEKSHLDMQLDLINEGHSNFLKHPAMWIWSEVHWLKHRWVYWTNLVLYLLFLASFTVHGCNYVDINQCMISQQDNTTCCFGFGLLLRETFVCHDFITHNCSLSCEKSTWHQNGNVARFDQVMKCLREIPLEEDKEAETMKNGKLIYHTLTWYSIVVLLTLLIPYEVFQFVSKAKAHRPWEYFDLQNVIECIYYCTTIAFLIIQNGEPDVAGHVLGWSLLFAWADLTLFLGRFKVMGMNISLALFVMKDVLWFLIVHFPGIIAFTIAFHCFLPGSDVFKGTVSSFMKVLLMMMGEFDFDEHFLYDKVDQTGGRNISLQLLLIFFIIYCGITVLSLLTAVMVTKASEDKSEILLLERRIGEISGISKTWSKEANQKLQRVHINLEGIRRNTPPCRSMKQFFELCKMKIRRHIFNQEKIQVLDDNGKPFGEIHDWIWFQAAIRSTLRIKKHDEQELIETVKKIRTENKEVVHVMVENTNQLTQTGYNEGVEYFNNVLEKALGNSHFLKSMQVDLELLKAGLQKKND